MNSNDKKEIELSLINDYGARYYLKWRYKEKRKFLWFNLKNKWHDLWIYDRPENASDEDPNNDEFWSKLSFDFNKEGEYDMYKKLEKTVSTKGDLFNYYGVYEKWETYSRDLMEYNERRRESEKKIKDAMNQ